MAKQKPFTWTVAFTVDPSWVADGFSLSNERAHNMLATELDCAYGHELEAIVVGAPSPLAVARVQGYDKRHPESGAVVRKLIADAPSANVLHNALVGAIDLLDSVAFVAKEGDTQKPLAALREALALISGEYEPVPA